jgi:hypothetical protein
MLDVLDLKHPLAMRELVSGKQQMRKSINSAQNVNETCHLLCVCWSNQIFPIF